MQEVKQILNDRYELVQRAGTGGMSMVYKGRDLLLGRTVAVKVLHESLTSDVEFLRRFQKEAHSAANLTHPNIVTVHDIGQDGRHYYIVMEYIEGWTLKDLIRQHYQQTGKPFSIHRAIDITIDICAGIGYAHRANLVHCDVKSQNVLVARDGRIKVTDFGIARALSESSTHGLDGIWGTPQYFSPEQAAGEAPSPASDVYSIGIILFEMLSGRLPFEADNHTALAVKHMREIPPLVSSYNPAVSPQIDRIVAKVLSKEPSGRYRTADQLGRVLTTYRSSSLEATGRNREAGELDVGVAERKTVFFQPIADGSKSAAATFLAEEITPTRLSNSANPELFFTMQEEESSTDWLAIGLGIIALISLLGLIPLWYLVYLRYAM